MLPPACLAEFPCTVLDARGGYTDEVASYLLSSASKAKQNVNTMEELYGQRESKAMDLYFHFVASEMEDFRQGQAEDLRRARPGPCQLSVAPLQALRFPDWQGVEADILLGSSFLAGCVSCGTSTGTSKSCSPAAAK